VLLAALLLTVAGIGIAVTMISVDAGSRPSRRPRYGQPVAGAPRSTVARIVAGATLHPERWDGRSVRIDGFVDHAVVGPAGGQPASAFELGDRPPENLMFPARLLIVAVRPEAFWQAWLHRLPGIGALVPRPQLPLRWWETYATHAHYLVRLRARVGPAPCSGRAPCISGDLLGASQAR
jgi:hypothetical protein